MGHYRASLLPPRRQRGSIIVPAAVTLLLAAMLLGGAQLGYLFYTKRDMQKAADLAALTGAQVLHNGDAAGCAAAATAASMAAQANFSGASAAGALEVACYRWDPVKNTADARHVSAVQPGDRYNAIRVGLTWTVPSLVPFMSGQPVAVESVAARPGNPVAAFSVGTTLVAANRQPGTLVNLLAAVGLNIDQTALVGYDAGLANVKITPSGLLKQLGIDVPADISVGGLNTLLAATTRPLGDLLDAVVTLGGHDELLGANATLINLLKAKLNVDSLNVTLGSESAGHTSSLFASINAPDGNSALTAQINALDLISTLLSVASGGHAVATDLTIPLLGLGDIQSRLGVIEPAQIAIGGVGTTAFSAQLRLFFSVTADTGKIPILGSLLDLTLDLPIAIDVVTATGTLTALCETQDTASRDLATIRVDASLLQTCVGGFDAASVFSSSQGCNTSSTLAQPLLSLKIAGVNLPSVNHPLSLPLLPSPPVSHDFHEGETATMGASNPLLLGTTLKNLTDDLLADLLGNLPPANSCASATVPGGDGGTSTGCKKEIRNVLAAQTSDGNQSASNALVALVGFLLSALQPILDSLGQALSSLLQNQIGLDIGQTDVHLMSLQCIGKEVQLVY